MIKSSALLALVLFCLTIISPQGIGVRFSLSLPHIDLPRIFIIFTIVISSVLLLMGRWRTTVESAPVSCSALIMMLIWCFSTASLSESPLESVLFVARIMTIGPLYSLAFCVLADDPSYKKETYLFMVLTVGLLILYSNLEFISQKYLVPISWRTCFYNIDSYDWVLRRVLRRGGFILSQGPYVWNHTLGGMFCVFSGLVWLVVEKRKFIGMVFCSMFFVAVYATGMRATTIAVTMSMLVWLVYRKKIENMVRISIALCSASIFCLLKIDKEFFWQGLFHVADISNSAEIVSSKVLNLDFVLVGKMIEKFSFGLISYDTAEILLRETGTVGIRLTGMLQNIGKIDDWWLFGYGAGAFMAPTKVSSLAVQYDDPSLFLVFMFEYGLPLALLIGLLILYALFQGFRNSKFGTWPLAIGVLSWSIFSLSSWAVWPMLPAFVMVILIEKWSKGHLKEEKAALKENEP